MPGNPTVKAPRKQGMAPAASSNELPAFLRARPDPALPLDDAQVHALLVQDPEAYLDFARAYLGALAWGHGRLVQPPKTLFAARGGSDFRVMPCVVDGPQGYLATVKIVGTNRAQKRLPGQVTVGQVCVMDPEEGFVSHRFDACTLSSARTGLCAALAVERLAADRSVVGIVGAGRVGYYAARYLAALSGVRKIRIFDVDAAQAQACAYALRPAVTGVQVVVVPSPEVRCPVTVLATTSREPFWPVSDQTASTLVVSLGADTLDQRELHRGWLSASLYTDAADSLGCGDLMAWRSAGLRVPPPTELLELLRGATGRPPGPAAFISTGSALLDNLTCAYLLAQLAGASASSQIKSSNL